MKSPCTPVVPRSLDRAKRVAKYLHSVYSQHPLSACQAVAARLFFFPDWHALQLAIKNKQPAGVFDDELPSDALMERVDAQCSILASAFGGPSIEYWERLASDVLVEIQPTALTPPPPFVTDAFTLCTAAELETVLRRLADWWRINVPNQPIVADALAAFPFYPNRLSSVLRFGAYWGELCKAYAAVVPLRLLMGVSFLLAERYATILLHISFDMDDLAAIKKACVDDTLDDIAGPYIGRQDELAGCFFEVFPRRDFGKIYAGQREGFFENAEYSLTLLGL